MNNEILLNALLGFFTFGLALMYRFGFFRIFLTKDPDKFFFLEVDLKHYRRVDNICFWIVSFMALLVLLNSILAFYLHVPIISMIFLVIAFPGTIIYRFLYIIFHGRRTWGNC